MKTSSKTASKVYVDSSCNKITVDEQEISHNELRLVVVRMADNPRLGYIAHREENGAFGDDTCPSSYGMPCLTWFGSGQRYPDSRIALNNIIKSSEPRIQFVRLYVNEAAMLVDIDYSDEDLPIGSNWRVTRREEAEKMKRELIAEGFIEGSEHPTYV